MNVSMTSVNYVQDVVGVLCVHYLVQRVSTLIQIVVLATGAVTMMLIVYNVVQQSAPSATPGMD